MARIFNTDTDIEAQNYVLFKDCFSTRVLLALDSDDSTDLDDFISFLAKDAWSILHCSVRTLSHKSDETVVTTILDDSIPNLGPIPPDFAESLATYGILAAGDLDSPELASQSFLLAVLEAYVPLAREPPPAWSSTRTTECEICKREVPLTYHHLVPRSVQARALKRGWHEGDVLNSVAWLCRYVFYTRIWKFRFFLYVSFIENLGLINKHSIYHLDPVIPWCTALLRMKNWLRVSIR